MTGTSDLEYYATHGDITNLGDFAADLTGLPTTIAGLRDTVQGLLLHTFWAARYGVEVPAEKKDEVNIRHVTGILAKLQETGEDTLTARRSPGKRFIGNCRTFSVVLAALLRAQGRPARARCGFGAYFEPGRFEDHWVCEYWNEEQQRWILVDAQLDEVQRKAMKIGFDPLDVPRDQFIVGGKAWETCRSGNADPERFGIFDMRGLWFIRGNVVRDIAALNKVELLPWDGWGLIDVPLGELSPAEWNLLDETARLTFEAVDFDAVRQAYENQTGFQVPPVIKSYTQSGEIEVDLAAEAVAG